MIAADFSPQFLMTKACPIASTVLQCSVVEHAAFPATTAGSTQNQSLKRKVGTKILEKKHTKVKKMWPFPCFLGPFSEVKKLEVFFGKCMRARRMMKIGEKLFLNSRAFHGFLCWHT